MFVTIFMESAPPQPLTRILHWGTQSAIFDSKSGALQSAQEPRNMIVGALENATFETAQLKLNPGRLHRFVYRRVTEATDAQGNESPKHGCAAILELHGESPGDRIVQNVIDEVRLSQPGFLSRMTLRH